MTTSPASPPDPGRPPPARARHRDALADAPLRRIDRRAWRYAPPWAAGRRRTGGGIRGRTCRSVWRGGRRPRIMHENKLGAAYENVSFGPSDGLTLKGWYVPSKNGAAVISLPGRGVPRDRRACSPRLRRARVRPPRRGHQRRRPERVQIDGDHDMRAAIKLQTRADVDPDPETADRPLGRRRDDARGGRGGP